MADSSLNYRERGEGTPLVLVHGFPFDGSIWEPVLEGLAGDARVLAPDLPGFGDSAPLSGQEASMDAYADALAAWAGELQLGKIVLGGHSMGGYMAFAFARKYPEMLAGFVPICTRPGADSETGRDGRYKQSAEVEQRGAQVIVDAMLPKLLASSTRERDPGIAEQVERVMLRQSPDSIRATLHAMASRPDSTSILDTLDVPVLVVSGAEDAIIPAPEADAMVAKVKGARQAIIPNAGHLPMLENPEELNSALRSFLQTL